VPVLRVPPVPIPRAFQEAVLAWYAANGRRLAFRATDDPYAVLVSELMAQQTQAERAAAAWTAWIARFPTVESLAAAPVADVVRAWAGLGYNRRAVNLQRAARVIVECHGGRVPDTVEDLDALPGVGPYTARAVAAIAFGRPAGAVDTNVRRVLGRVAAGDPSSLSAAELQGLADGAVPVGRAADWTHALMDVGALACRPRTPRCDACPARPWCRFAAGDRPAGATAPPVAARSSEPAFPETTRWLRGRIVARARDAADGSWVSFEGPIGVHGQLEVREAVAALAREGLLEVRDTTNGPEARLPA
jgi:A/G-specific adenine glycosylase